MPNLDLIPAPRPEMAAEKTLHTADFLIFHWPSRQTDVAFVTLDRRLNFRFRPRYVSIHHITEHASDR